MLVRKRGEPNIINGPKPIAKLERNLNEWVTLGLITHEQAEGIHKHESAKPENSWVMAGLLILGASTIGIGVISLIAANWQAIPEAVKLLADFLILGGIAYATLRSWELHKGVAFEAWLLFFNIFCLASIGLIAQVFHSGGRPYQALLFWTVITFGPTLAARRMPVPFLWTGALIASLIGAALESVTLQHVFHHQYSALAMFLPFLCSGLTVLSRQVAGDTSTTQALRFWTIICGLFALWFVDSPLSGQSFRAAGTGIGLAMVPGYICAGITAFAIIIGQHYRHVQKLLLLVTVGAFLLPFHLRLAGVGSELAYAFCSLAIYMPMALFFASIKSRRLFNWFLFFTGMRVLGLYFQALGGLAVTGVGLILSGALVIGMGVLWKKHRAALVTWAERWTQ